MDVCFTKIIWWYIFINVPGCGCMHSVGWRPDHWSSEFAAEVLTFDDLLSPVDGIQHIVLSSTATLEQSIVDGFFERFSATTRIQACVNVNIGAG